MICDNCKIKRSEKDFINNQKFCYQCVYRIKLLNIRENRTPKTTYVDVVKKKSSKKKTRKNVKERFFVLKNAP